MPQKYFTVEGIATHVVHTGATTLPGVPPDTSRGRAVLCLHGSGGNAGTFAPLLERLAGAHSPVAFDMPGHARSGGLDSLGTVERMADFCAGVIDSLGLRRPVLLGHSLGGAVAVQVALAHPQRVGGLVVVGASAPFPPLPDEGLDALRRVVEGKARRSFSRDGWSPATPDEVVQRGWMEDVKTDPRVAWGDMRAVRAWEPRAVGSIAAPTLVVWGEDEFAALRDAARQLAGRIRGARGVEIPEAGHMVHVEQPDALVGALGSFLAEAAA